MKRLWMIVTVIGFSSWAQAQDRVSVRLTTADNFHAIPVQKVNPSRIFAHASASPFKEWSVQSPNELALLSLYPGIGEPNVSYTENGEVKLRKEELVMVTVRTKTALKIRPEAIELKSVLDIEKLNGLAPEIVNRVIPAEKLVSMGSRDNFKWCNEQAGTYITRVGREGDLSFLNPKNRQWCSDKERSICVESCYRFGQLFEFGLEQVNKAAKDRKDAGLAMQSEVRYFHDEAQYGANVRQLTKIDSDVVGIFEQNTMYVHQFILYGKVLSVVQVHPTDKTKTIMTTHVLFAIRKHSWEKYPVAPDIFMGESKLFNSNEGLMAGIPVFAQDMTRKIAKLIEANPKQ
jgi:hypothetical protein